MAATKQARITPIRKFGRVVRNLLGVLLGAAFAAILLSLLPVQGMYKLYTVQSGSMSPKIPTGSLVVVIPSDSYAVGDVITFTDSADSTSTTTHRIIGLNGTSYLTKGDANDGADIDPVQKTNVVGKVIFHLPYIGYPVGYAKTLPGLIILIVIPATIIIWEELKKLKKEWHRSQKEEKKQAPVKALSKKTYTIPVTQHRSTDKKQKITSISITTFILMATVSMSTLSIKAFFNDQEPAAGSMTSGAWQSNCLVINEVFYHVDDAHGHDGEDGHGKKEDDDRQSDHDEWFEIYNNCNRAVSLKKWTITDNEKTLTIHSNKTVPAHGYGLISKSASTWTKHWGFKGLGNLENIQIIEIGENGSPTHQVFDNAGDKLLLKNPDGVIIDQMNYGNNTVVWNPAVPGVAEGHSLARNPVGYDTDRPGDFVENALPSPGQPTVTVRAGH